MHIFFSGIGGAGLGPLALIAHQAGYRVSGSDKQDSQYIHYLQDHGIENIEIGQTVEQIEAAHARDPIDWYVYSSAVAIDNPNAPEFRFCRAEHIKSSKRDVLLNAILADKHLSLVAIAGTHGKTTTTAMAIWLMKRIGMPVSYSVGAKIAFGDMGHFDPASKYFVYEADEFDRNFLSFQPYISIITGVDYDHHDIYPTREEYQAAFRQFLEQSSYGLLWDEDVETLGAKELGIPPEPGQPTKYKVVSKLDHQINELVHLAGPVNRQDAWQVANALLPLSGLSLEQLLTHLETFPGVSRRFEQIVPNLYSDYAHTPPKIRGTLQTAHEVAKDQNVIVIYEGLHNTRQHFIKDELKSIFDHVHHLYIVPSYLAREDKTLDVWSPADIKALLSETSREHTTATSLDTPLMQALKNHLKEGDLVVCMSAGGGGSLDEWLRKEFAQSTFTTPDTPTETV